MNNNDEINSDKDEYKHKHLIELTRYLQKNDLSLKDFLVLKTYNKPVEPNALMLKMSEGDLHASIQSQFEADSLEYPCIIKSAGSKWDATLELEGIFFYFEKLFISKDNYFDILSVRERGFNPQTSEGLYLEDISELPLT